MTAAVFRWSIVDGPERRCAHCGDWWSVGEDAPEFWVIGKWNRCKVCLRELSRLYQAMRRRDPEFRAADVLKSTRYRAYVRRLAPEHIRAYDRERMHAARERRRLRLVEQRDAA